MEQVKSFMSGVLNSLLSNPSTRPIVQNFIASLLTAVTLWLVGKGLVSEEIAKEVDKKTVPVLTELQKLNEMEKVNLDLKSKEMEHWGIEVPK